MSYTKTIIIFITTLFISEAVLSSGSGGGGGYGGGYSSPHQRSVKQIDQTYESGKAIYNGRNKNVAKLNYCVANNEQKVAIKRAAIRKFKNTSYTELSNNLYNCDKPEDLISKSMNSDQLVYVIYYLNKRYRLNLATK